MHNESFWLSWFSDPRRTRHRKCVSCSTYSHENLKLFNFIYDQEGLFDSISLWNALLTDFECINEIHKWVMSNLHWVNPQNQSKIVDTEPKHSANIADCQKFKILWKLQNVLENLGKSSKSLCNRGSFIISFY